MAHAISGEGSIKRRKTGKLAGKWRVQWSYDDPAIQEYIQVDRTFMKQEDAKTFLGDLKAKVRTGQMVESTKAKKQLTLSAWFDELAGTKDKDLEGLWREDGTQESTISYREGRFNKYVRKSELAGKAIPHITVEAARQFFRKLKDSGVGLPTIKALKIDLVKTLNDAIDTYERYPHLRNVFSKVKIEAPALREGIALSPEDAKNAILAQRSYEARAMLGLFLFAGLRLGEQMAITKEQIDYKKGVIVIDRAIKLSKTGAQSIGFPKGGTERKPKTRIVVMCPTLAQMLIPLTRQPGQYLFPSATEDKPRMKKLVYATWRKMRKHGKLPATMVLRDCRLSHNNWIEKLMPTVSTSTRLEHMGHSVSTGASEHKGIVVNLSNYTRTLSEAHDTLRSELERVLGLSVYDLAPVFDASDD